MPFGVSVELASLYARVGADTSQFDHAMNRTKRGLGATGKAMKLFGGIAVAGIAIKGVRDLSGAFMDSIQVASEFEKVMSGTKAVLGANDKTMDKLRKTALRLGKDTAFSAGEAADAIEMLAKNGVSAADILNGMADATISLAAATKSDLSTAADIATDAMAAFHLETSQLKQAINGISGVVVSSKFDINDYALALAQGGGVAASVGVEFDDFNTSIAAIAPLFAGGSDAGTSFKVFLQRLVPDTKPARKMMEELGLLTEEGSNRFFDATGNMKSMSEISGILAEALAGLSDEQKNSALQTLFGTDAMRAAVGLAETGSAGFDALSESMSKVDASAQALTRLDNLAGDMEQLSGSVETLKINLGNAFAPVIRKLVQRLTEEVNKFLEVDMDAFADKVLKSGDAVMTFYRNANTMFPQIAGITDKFATDTSRSLQGIYDSWQNIVHLFMGKDREDTVSGFAQTFTTIYRIVTTTVSGILTAMDALLQALVIMAQIGETIRSGDIGGIFAAMKRFSRIIEGFQGTVIEDVAKWMDPLFWLGIRPGSQSSGAQTQSNSSPSSFPTMSGGVTVNVSADAIPTDRVKIQALAQMLWREAELAGMRI